MQSMIFSVLLCSCGRQAAPQKPSPVSVPVTDTPDLVAIASMEEKIEISAAEIEEKVSLLWVQHRTKEQQDPTRQREYQKNVVEKDGVTMRYALSRKGEKPEGGYPLFIALHGGGGAPAHVNDQQWNHMKRYYLDGIETGIYVAARGISDNWNLHFESGSYPLYDRIIDNLILWEDVHPDQVYFLGFSAGGDGVYQIAPRMADRLAGANMSAGHPNGTSPINLYTVPFAIQMGEKDSAYNRNKVAAQYAIQLQKLQAKNKKGYVHELFLHKNGTHNYPWRDNDPRKTMYSVVSDPEQWLQGSSNSTVKKDSNAIRWLIQNQRTAHPTHLIWDTKTRAGSRGDRANSHYWIEQKTASGTIEISVQDNTFSIVKAQGDFRISIDPKIVDVTQPVVVQKGKDILFSQKVVPDLRVVARSILQYNDPERIYVASIDVSMPASP